jgi:hypothetical protein
LWDGVVFEGFEPEVRIATNVLTTNEKAERASVIFLEREE